MVLGGFHPCCSSCWNLSPINYKEDELVKDPGPTNCSHFGNTCLVPTCNPTSGPALVPALIPALVSALARALPSFNKLFKQFIKVYLKSNQGPRQPSAEHEEFLKAKVTNIYYGKLHMDYYHFCQKYKVHFKTAGASRVNRTLFAAFFLCESISV